MHRNGQIPPKLLACLLVHSCLRITRPTTSSLIADECGVNLFLQKVLKTAYIFFGLKKLKFYNLNVVDASSLPRLFVSLSKESL